MADPDTPRTASAVEARDLRSDTALLDSAAQDSSAFGEFYLRHGGSLFAYFRVRASSAQDAYDLVAETFADAMASVQTFDAGRGTPRAWLFGIARHKLFRYLRRGAVDSRARRRMGIDPVSLDPEALDELEQVIDLSHASHRLASALERLPELTATVIRRHYLDGQPYDEFAPALGLTTAAARQRASRGLVQLAADISDNPFCNHG